MIYRKLGSAGIKLSVFGLGSWVTFGKQVHRSDAKELLKSAYDKGINFFDNAEGYEAGQSEKIMGEAIAALGLSRDTYVISSKVFWGGDKPTQMGLGAKHIREACDAALRRLKVDYLDLFYCHRPDVDTPIEETVRAMHNLVVQGKVLYWGTSEWSAAQITQAHAVAHAHHLTPPVMEQPQYNMFVRERVEAEYRSLYQDYGLGITSYSPLASGLLTGKYLNGIPGNSRLALSDYGWLREELKVGDKLESIANLKILAEESGLSLTHLALLWCVKNPNISSVILGASQLSQLQDNLLSLEVLSQVDESMMTKIDELLGNKPAEPERFGQ